MASGTVRAEREYTWGELLWENPSPASTFNAQTVQTPGISNYKFVAFIVIAGTNVATTKVGTAIICPYENGKIMSIYGSLFGSSSQRDVTLGTSSCDISARADNNNAYLIPTRIYGIR